MGKIFLSYSRRDTSYADYLTGHLTGAGHRVWFDRQGIRGGDQWRRSIVSAISGCDHFLVMLSPFSIASKNVRKEIDLAEHHGKAILPVAIAPVEVPDEMSYQLIGIQIVNLWQDHPGGLQALDGALGQAAASAQPPQAPRRERPRGEEARADLSGLGGGGFIERLSSGGLFGGRKR